MTMKLDNNSKQVGPAGKDGLDSTVPGPKGEDAIAQGVTYTESTFTTNITKNINVGGLINGIDGAIRNDTAIAESIAIGANIVCGQNIVNNGNIYTNNIYAKSIVVDTILRTVFIDDVPMQSKIAIRHELEANRTDWGHWK